MPEISDNGVSAQIMVKLDGVGRKHLEGIYGSIVDLMGDIGVGVVGWQVSVVDDLDRDPSEFDEAEQVARFLGFLDEETEDAIEFGRVMGAAGILDS